MQRKKDQTPTSLHPPRVSAAPLRVGVLLSGFLLLFAPGCARRQPQDGFAAMLSDENSRTDAAATDIRAILRQYTHHVNLTLRETALAIEKNSPTREQHKAALHMRSRVATEIRETSAQPDPLNALLDTWAYILRFRHYVETGDASQTFGRNQPLVVEAAVNLNEKIESLVHDVLGPKAYAEIEKKTREYAENRAMTGPLTAPVSSGDLFFTLESSGREAVGLLAGIPLAPVRAIGRIGEGASSIRDFSVTANRFTDIVEGLPEQSRIQLELLYLDIQDSTMATSTLQNLDQLTRNTTRFLDVAEALPERLGREIQKTLAQVEEQQPSMSQLLDDARHTLAEARDTARALDDTIRSATLAGNAWRDTADSTAAATREIARLAAPNPDRDPDAPPGKPFDIDDYTRTALALTTGTVQLRLLLQDLENLTSPDGLDARMHLLNRHAETVLDDSVQRLQTLVDRIALRIAQLLALALVLALLYRWLARNRTTAPS